MALLSPSLSHASDPVAPHLPAPTGRVVTVSSEPELRQAVRSLTSDTTILIRPGVYNLAGTLALSGPLRNVTIRGATNNRDEVVLAGPGMTNGAVASGIWTGGVVDRLTIANLTVRDFFQHCVIFNAGTASPRLYNVRLANAGQQIVKSNPDATGGGVDDGVVEYSIVEFSTTSRDSYTNGVDVLGGRRWAIRHNLFRNIRSAAGQMAGPAVLMWRGARDSVTEGNTFVDCQRPIAYGLEVTSPADHSGGVIRNNFIFRRSSQPGDARIVVFGSPDTVVAHNTILVSGPYGAAIEYRFPQATGVQILNNLTDAAIVGWDGATATVTGNYTQAMASMFADAAGGNLHLVASATVAIDQAMPGVSVAVDWDGQTRPHGARSDNGADEFVGGAVLSEPPRNSRIVR
jgi:hypothetical protein